MAQKPRSAEMTPGPGFRIRVNIDRPSPNLIEKYRKFDSPDISDMLNRMYTMSPEIRSLSGNGRLELRRSS